MIADSRQRAAAIDVTRSCIVQAPAGSGKTELLIQRILALLAEAERPQQILAITFTNKAAAEMRQRLLRALKAARDDSCPKTPHEKLTWELAERALTKHGDHLLLNPAQLAIQTIDSFNAALVRKMPWLSRFGSLPEISEDADTLYQQAAENLLAKIGDVANGGEQIYLLLRHLDNNVAGVQRMLVAMLQRRDQWLRHLVNHHENSRQTLQQGLEEFCVGQLTQLKESFPRGLGAELLYCVNFSVAGHDDYGAEGYFDDLPGCEFGDLSRWLLIAELLLTSAGTLRKTVTKNNGFPARTEAKDRMLELLNKFAPESSFLRQLEAIKKLPTVGYSNQQWELLQALIELLPLLVGELWLVFRSRSQSDFAEIALKAGHALGEADSPSDLLLQIDHDLHHILIDEFQDTSQLQYQLLNTLTSGWTAEDGRTLFLVGDPMQSIYRFREAEVGLFIKCFKGEFGDSHLQLQPLQLSCNFRSQQGIVDWVNQAFALIFPLFMDEATGAVPLSEALAVKPQLLADACRVYPFIGRNDSAEAEQVLSLIKQAQMEDPEQTIAILVRGRSHLRGILPLLRQNHIDYQAKDIDPLSARPAALDVIHLTRALLHRGDYLSWLAVLRAPWCGLTLNDLTLLTADSSVTTLPALLDNEQLKEQLSADGQQRLARTWPILQASLKSFSRLPLRQLIEGCWLALGGAACYGKEGLADIVMVFNLLEKLDRGGDLESFELLERGVKKLFAEPDSQADGKLQIMTIHKAKGLEFDTVIIPGLGKTTGRNDSPLLRWLEHPDYGLLLAPVSAKGSREKDPVYQLIKRLEDEKADLETSRLLYVATTRAIRHLHLLGHVKEDRDAPDKGTLLQKLWPILHETFASAKKNEEMVEEKFLPPLLRRLPLDWQMPQPISANVAVVPKSETASSSATGTVFSGWENPLHRHVGTLVHLQLERIAKFGSECWLADGGEKLNQTLKGFLSSYGVANADLGKGVQKVITAIDTTLGSRRGRWILENHLEHKCELPLTGVVDGKLIHAVIDRTFVAKGSRWVIDYKTSAPAAGETKMFFLQREGEHYRDQLDMYARLLTLQSDQFPIKMALYFPLFNGWYEY